MVFKYVAKNEKGKTTLGNVEASSLKLAASLLMEKGLVVVSIIPEKKNTVEEIISSVRRITLTDRVNFTHQLSVMVASGLTLSQSLTLFISQLKASPLLDAASEILKDVEGGLPFSKSLEKFPNVFPATYISLIRSGEASGNLDVILKRLADSLEKQREFRSKVKAAMIYPIIVSIAMILVFVVIMIFAIPKFTAMYSSLDVELPLPTKIMIGVSNFFVTRWYLLLSTIVLGFLGIRFYKGTEYGKHHLARISLNLPIFGPINKQKELAEFTRTLSLLINAGVPIVDSLNISSESVDNILYTETIKEAAGKVEKGAPLSDMIQADKNFPPIVSQMIAVGQETGKMDEVLLKLATYFEGEVDLKLKNLSTALEPIIIVVLGVMVGALILSIITPIYKLTTAL